MFDKATRTLIAMLFERSTVDEIDGNLDDGRGYSVNCRRPTPYLDYTFYDGYIAGCYDDFRGDTLEETLDKMNAYLAAHPVAMVLVTEATA
jgi:hypothetical protein